MDKVKEGLLSRVSILRLTHFHFLLLAGKPFSPTHLDSGSMTEAQLKKQLLFGNLLRGEFGTPLLIPNKHIRAGDVGYFLGARCARLFNAFDLTEAVITLPPS